MTVKAIMPVRLLNPVEPLGHKPTAMRTTETGEPKQLALWSGAVTGLISESFRTGDVDSSNNRMTPATTPSSRTSITASAPGTPRAPSAGLVLSA